MIDQRFASLLGVFWHTRGSGKSLSMLFFTQTVLRREPGNWLFAMITDRAELDDQLYGEFKDAGVRQPVDHTLIARFGTRRSCVDVFGSSRSRSRRCAGSTCLARHLRSRRR
jgi:hypothetical protein